MVLLYTNASQTRNFSFFIFHYSSFIKINQELITLQQIIYVDVLVILNLIITFLLLSATEFFLKEKASGWRLFFGALAGGIYSLQVFLPEMGVILNILSRITVGVAIVYISFGFKTYKRFLKIVSVFLLMTFIFAGLMISLWIIFRPSGMLINNSTVYFGISLPVLIISTAVCYVLVRLIFRIVLKNKPQQTLFDFILEIDGRKLTGRAMLDTGNTLSESFSGYPVVVCTYDFLNEIFPANSHDFFKGDITALGKIQDGNWKKRVRIVSFSTVSQTGAMPSFHPDRLIVENHFETEMVFVAVTSRKKYINESFDMLLNPDLF